MFSPSSSSTSSSSSSATVTTTAPPLAPANPPPPSSQPTADAPQSVSEETATKNQVRSQPNHQESSIPAIVESKVTAVPAKRKPTAKRFSVIDTSGSGEFDVTGGSDDVIPLASSIATTTTASTTASQSSNHSNVKAIGGVAGKIQQFSGK